MTIFECYNQTKQMLKASDIEDYVFEAKQILYFITKYDSGKILERYNEQLDDVKQSLWTVTVKQRCTGYPLQYILGEWDFYGLRFFVGEGCLVPRSDTETLVDVALEFLKEKNGAEVLDLCAGSGCVGLTVANRFKNCNVELVEKYETPLFYLRKNAQRIAKDNTNVTAADIFDWVTDKTYDLILSNPPYISAEEMPMVNKEAQYEPHTALYGGEDGLDYYRVILTRYAKCLNSGGLMAVEVGFSQSDAVKELFRQAGFSNINTKEDLSGIQRVVFGTLNEL